MTRIQHLATQLLSLQMVSTLFLAFLLSMALHSAHCCEGDCQTGITAAFIRKYSKPVQSVFSHLVGNLVRTILDRSLKLVALPPTRQQKYPKISPYL